MENQMEKQVEKQVDLNSVKPIENSSIDLEQYDKKEIEIEKVEVIRVNSKFSTAPDGKQYVLKVSSVVVETIGKGDDKIEFRASELFNLSENEKGELIGFPTGEGSKLMKFVKDLGIRDVSGFKSLKELVDNMIGRKALIKAYQKEYQGNQRTYLEFRY